MCVCIHIIYSSTYSSKAAATGVRSEVSMAGDIIIHI